MKPIIINDSKISYSNVIDFLDIRRDDIVVVSSDITRLFYIEYERTGIIPNPNVLIDSIKEKVGRMGTVLFPVFNWDFCKGITFDYKKTKGKTGTLGNVALKRNDFRRTKHPIYSFMVSGYHQDFFCNLTNKNSFGKGSIFDYFSELNVKFMLVDITMDQGFTFVHHIEQLGQVPYRYHKEFTSQYVDELGETTERGYSMFVRDLEMNPIQNLDPIEYDFFEIGIMRKYLINDISYLIIKAKDALNPILDDIKNNRSKKIFKYTGQ